MEYHFLPAGICMKHNAGAPDHLYALHNYTRTNPFACDDYHNAWVNYLLSPSINDYPYPIANIQADRTRGMITGTKTKILGTSNYLYTCSSTTTKAG